MHDRYEQHGFDLPAVTLTIRDAERTQTRPHCILFRRSWLGLKQLMVTSPEGPQPISHADADRLLHEGSAEWDERSRRERFNDPVHPD